jgi:hypothetical protein
MDILGKLSSKNSYLVIFKADAVSEADQFPCTWPEEEWTGRRRARSFWIAGEENGGLWAAAGLRNRGGPLPLGQRGQQSQVPWCVWAVDMLGQNLHRLAAADDGRERTVELAERAPRLSPAKDQG